MQILKACVYTYMHNRIYFLQQSNFKVAIYYTNVLKIGQLKWARFELQNML